MLEAGRTEYVDLGEHKAWREGVEAVESYEGTYTNAPDGMMLRAWMGDAAVRRTWSSARDTSTYVTNGRVILIPGDNAGDLAWLNARKDFENELRLEVATGRVAEVRVGVRDFTQGYAKVGLLPEYFPGRLYDDWNGTALYLEMSRSGGNINFRAYRTWGTGGARTPLADETSAAYDDVSDVTVQVSSNWFKAYYGTNVVVDAGHGIGEFAGVYPNGLHVHVEFQSSQAQGYMGLEGLKCRLRDGFGLEE